MRGKIISLVGSPTSFKDTDGHFKFQNTSILVLPTPDRCQQLIHSPSYLLNNRLVNSANLKNGLSFQHLPIKSVGDVDQGYPNYEDEDDDLCPVECVREFKTDEEFIAILEKAKKNNALVVVDFYRTSCGSCKYIEQGFSKMCKASGDEDAPVIFLKHNVLDEYDEQSEVADRLRIKTVPLFQFYKNGKLLEAFPTRDKERITEAIYRYISSTQDA